MSDSGTKAPASKTLNYSLDFRTLDRLKGANVATQNVKLQELQQIGQIADIATTGIAMTTQAMEKGAAITQERLGQWEDFKDRESWASPEYYDEFMANEKVFREQYASAVRNGRTQEADRLLADQKQRSNDLQGHVEAAELAKQTLEAGNYMGYDPALGTKNIINEADHAYLTAWVHNKNTVPMNVDGRNLVGVDVSSEFGITPVDPEFVGPLQGPQPQDFMTDGKLDPAKVAKELGITEEEAKSYVLRDGKIYRAHTSTEVKSLLEKATKPTALGDAVMDTFKTMETEASKNPKKFHVSFNNEDISTKYGNFITDHNMVRKSAVSEIAGRTFIDDFVSDENDIWTNLKTYNLNGAIIINDETTPDALKNLDLQANGGNGDGKISPEELAAFTGTDRALIVQELMKPENIEMYKSYWGEWAMLRARGRVQDILTGLGVKDMDAAITQPTDPQLAGISGTVIDMSAAFGGVSGANRPSSSRNNN